MENSNKSKMTNINIRITTQEKDLLSYLASEQNLDLTNYLKTTLFEELPNLRGYSKSTANREEALKALTNEIETQKRIIIDLQTSLKGYTSISSLNSLYEDTVSKTCEVRGKVFNISSRVDLIKALSLNYIVDNTDE